MIGRIVVIAAAILCTGLLVRAFWGRSDAATVNGQAAGPEQNASAVSTQDASAGTQSLPSEPEMLHLTADQIRKGDLILVNGTYPYDFEVNSDVVLANIRAEQSFYYQVDNTDFQVAAPILPHLDKMIAACDAAMGTSETGITSAYRSFEYQQNVWNTMAEQYGESYAESYVADPGYSEHHTGYAVDVGIFYSDGSQGSFSESKNAVWMNDHSSEFGFIRRYAEDKVKITGISNEAWHFRYVGLPHAAYMKKKNLCLEEYLDLLRKKTKQDKPLTISTDEGTYEVWYTTETEIPVPEGEYTVSGDNMNGYIITVRK